MVALLPAIGGGLLASIRLKDLRLDAGESVSEEIVRIGNLESRIDLFPFLATQHVGQLAGGPNLVRRCQGMECSHTLVACALAPEL